MNRNKIKAHGLTALSDSILIFGTLTAGLSVYEPFTHIINESFGVGCAIIVAFIAHGALGSILTSGFGPLIDRLNATATTDTAATEGREDAEDADTKTTA